ncbi:hypothetical protein DESC_480235 [Desulfosarcina cetonica]|nr:hypothetical protein DESC_480235 [Desulfosarcina cetonica]
MGQPDGKGGAGSGFGFDRDDPAMALNDAGRYGQAQSRALAHGLGREKGIEQLVQVIGQDAAARVGDADFHTAFRPLAGIAGGDLDPAAGRHGVEGVEDHVDQHALALVPVEHQNGQGRVGLENQVDAFDQGLVLHQPDTVLDQHVHIHGRGGEFGLAGEVEQALDDAAHPFGLGGHDRKIVAHVLGQVRAAQDQVGEGQDGRQRIVDLMGHAGGQFTHAGLLLRLDQAGFTLLALHPFPLLQGLHHDHELLLQLADVVAGNRSDVRMEVAAGDLRAGADEIAHRPHDAPGEQPAEHDGEKHAGQGNAGEHGDGLIANVRVLVLQHAHVKHARPVAGDIGQRLIGGNVPVGQHHGTVGPAFAFSQHATGNLR